MTDPGSTQTVTARRERRRAVVASTVGTTIEWYDFFLYGTASALIFPALFFPKQAAYSGILLSFGYMAGCAILTPDLWLEPLGALVKTGPAIVLMLVALLTLDNR